VVVLVVELLSTGLTRNLAIMMMYQKRYVDSNGSVKFIIVDRVQCTFPNPNGFSCPMGLFMSY